MMDLEIYDAFRSAGVADDKARAAVASINSVIDRRYALHEKQLFTKADGTSLKADMAELKADMHKSLAEMQRWTLTALFAGLAAAAAINKLL